MSNGPCYIFAIEPIFRLEGMYIDDASKSYAEWPASQNAVQCHIIITEDKTLLIAWKTLTMIKECVTQAQLLSVIRHGCNKWWQIHETLNKTSSSHINSLNQKLSHVKELHELGQMLRKQIPCTITFLSSERQFFGLGSFLVDLI